ncbi:MSHA biogenesis protein MshO [Shewanella sp. NFH-SH190041]|uniref:PilW family protein n=1 Tax=Shewanella sp. NFH-SH190041 TaxID=2950245 RepID=UPI0021C35CE9|nr:type II secretion system protein [Shewanella sp. NFH-SH190041]BDM63093.1 MSHA biogenesis protein MshO [Shewanella sp. NFH-SH190041]
MAVAGFSGLSRRRRRLGFTLVEMVTVLIILGVIAVGVSSFLIFGTRIFVDSTSVDQVLSQSRFALERMTRELRGAVPNSLRVKTDGVSWQCLEFVPIVASTSYLDMPIYPQSAASSGTVIKPINPIISDQMALIYPLVSGDVYSDPASTTGKLFDLKQVSEDNHEQTLTFERPVQFAEASPRQRVFFVTQPVSYCFITESDGGNLYRFANYGINHPQQLTPLQMSNGVLMAQNISNDIATDPPFSLTPSTLVNNALVQLTPEFQVIGEKFRYQQQVQVINVP